VTVSNSRVTIYGMLEDRYAILRSCAGWLDDAQRESIRNAPANAECIIVEYLESRLPDEPGLPRVRLSFSTNVRFKHLGKAPK
jgi:hypothetical protein